MKHGEARALLERWSVEGRRVVHEADTKRLLALAGAAAFLAAGALEDAGLLGRASYGSQACFGLASAMILTGLVAAERAGKLRVGGALVLLGAASYSLYLIHTVAIGLALHILGNHGAFAVLPAWAAMALGTSVGVASGLLLYKAVELPITNAVRRRERARRAPRPARLVAEAPLP